MHPRRCSWEQSLYEGQHSNPARSITPCWYFLTCFSMNHDFTNRITVHFVSYCALSVVAEQAEATCKFMTDTASQTQMNTTTFSCTSPIIFNQITTYTWSNGSGGLKKIIIITAYRLILTPDAARLSWRQLENTEHCNLCSNVLHFPSCVNKTPNTKMFDFHETVHRDTTMKITNKMHYID
jgi:hypothetical protein